MSVTPSQFDLLSSMLDVSAERHRVISHNIANVNTPGFHAQRLSFDQQLNQMLDAPSLEEMVRLAEENEGVTADTDSPERADGNNVDIDREIGSLNKNSLMYQTYSQVLASKLSMMRSAITGR